MKKSIILLSVLLAIVILKTTQVLAQQGQPLIVSCKSKTLTSQETPFGVTDSVNYIALWKAGVPEISKNLSLVREKNSDWKIEKINGVFVASIVPVNDYHERAAYTINVKKIPVSSAWLVLEYLDKGYGMISISENISDLNKWGVARLNTGKLRYASFRVEPSAFEQSLRIYGIEYLRAVSLTAIEPQREPLPDALPAFNLKHPMALVMGGLTDNWNGNFELTQAEMRNKLPLVRALGFQAVESYVRWNSVEAIKGVFDWSYYDAIVAEIKKNGLLWSPFVIAGPAYTLPKWFHDSPYFLGYKCLEHNQRSDIQTIFSDKWPTYVQRYLAEFGKHYRNGGAVMEMNLGISGCYGEVLYPASAGSNIGFNGQPLHAHDGYWAGGKEAFQSFQIWLRAHYPSIKDLNLTWKSKFSTFDNIETFLPETAMTARQKLDFYDWYMDSMSDWADHWDQWAKQAMPGTPIYQKVGGWGNIMDGADFARITRDAAKRGIRIRETTEHDNFAFNFGMIRLLSSATRFYDTGFGMEPAGPLTARGIVSRIFGALVSDADELFFYSSNLFSDEKSITKWLRYAPLLDHRAKPVIDVAVFYPNTAMKLGEVGRSLEGPFFSRAYSLRSITDHDFVSEQMIMDGALDQYKVLIFLWGAQIEKPVLDRIAKWVEAGGTVITPIALQTVEGDRSVQKAWEQGKTGKGQFIRYLEHEANPSEYYLRFLRSHLLEINGYHPYMLKALQMDKPETVYWSLLQNGELALLNYDDAPATVRFDGKTIQMEPYSICIKQLTRKLSVEK